jgi:hypothetical protein
VPAPLLPPAGYLQLDLMSTTGTDCNANQHALCLSSFQIGIAADCNVALTPLLGSGVYAPGIWSSNPGATYARPVACPSWTTAAVDPGSSDATPEQLKAAIKTALQRHVYGASYELGVNSVVWSQGTVTVNTVAGGCAIEYAITQVRFTQWSRARTCRRCCMGAATAMRSPVASAWPLSCVWLPADPTHPAGLSRRRQLLHPNRRRRGARLVRVLRSAPAGTWRLPRGRHLRGWVY